MSVILAPEQGLDITKSGVVLQVGTMKALHVYEVSNILAPNHGLIITKSGLSNRQSFVTLGCFSRGDSGL